MPKLRQTLGVYFVLIVACGFAFAKVGHPRILTSKEGKVELEEKIKTADWAAKAYLSIKKKIAPYVERHQKDPNWIVSRLQMYWDKRYTDVYVNGGIFSHGSGTAPVPTPKFAGARDWDTPYASPEIEEIKPYMTKEKKIWLQNTSKPGNSWEWAPVSKTGHIIEHINERIIRLAQDAAFLYWYTGEEKYATFASDIFWTYTNGMYYRNNPTTYKDHSNSDIIGLATFEVIHEDITIPLAVTYDYLYDYLKAQGKDVTKVQSVFKRWANRIIEGGSGAGNWNINQIRFIVFLGLALEDDQQYEDDKGRQYYVSYFTTRSSENQTAIGEVIPKEYDQKTGIWPEAPGYAFSVTNNITMIAHYVNNVSDRDILENYPLLEKSAIVIFEYLWPNGKTIGVGDTYHQSTSTEAMEYMLARARKYDYPEMEKKVTYGLKQQMKYCGYKRKNNRGVLELTSYVGKIQDYDYGNLQFASRVFFIEPINALVQRNGFDPLTGLMLSVAGTKGGHVHANGMALELYGCGMVMGPDAGRGPSYWHKSHGEYYSRFPAHNTVIVDGISDYDPHRGQRRHDLAFDIRYIEPKSGSSEHLSENISFSDISFIEPKTQSLQRRLLSLVRTSNKSGYYVDVFRSHRRNGNDKKHEYLYHNIGKSVTFFDDQGNPIEMNSTDELSSEKGDLVGYDYFTDKKMVAYEDDFTALWSVELSNQPDAFMKMFMMGQSGRELFKVMAPKSRALLRGSVPSEITEDKLPTAVIRQNGEAWDRPFVAVFEPFSEKQGNTVKSVEQLDFPRQNGGIVGLKVDSLIRGGSRRTDYIFNTTNPDFKYKSGDYVFRGIYGLISNSGDEQIFYLGSGSKLTDDGIGLSNSQNVISARLTISKDKVTLSSGEQVTVTLPVEEPGTYSVTQLTGNKKNQLKVSAEDTQAGYVISFQAKPAYDSTIAVNKI